MLGVSEHELLTASEDVEARNAETLARKYLALLRRVRWTQYILYGGTALICLICNLAVDHSLTWFWLVLTGELTGASLTLLPVLVKQYRGAVTLGGFTLSLELLLLAACLFSGGDWFPIPALPGTLFGLAFPWGWTLILRYAPIGRWWKGAACLGWTGVLLPLVNPVADRLVRWGGGSVEFQHAFWFRPDLTNWSNEWTFNENVLFLLWLCLAGAAVLCVLRAVFGRKG